MISRVLVHCILISAAFVSWLCGQPVVPDNSFGDSKRFAAIEKNDGSETGVISGEQLSQSFICPHVVLERNQYILLPGNETYVIDRNKTYEPWEFRLIGDKLCITKDEVIRRSGQRILTCKKWVYDPDEFEVLNNGSVLLYEEIIDDYEIHGLSLYTCAPDEPQTGVTLEQVLIYIGKTGTVISIIALMAHLTVFCMVPSLRNLPGYNLASLSIAFLFAYLFIVIGQIPEVLGTFCIVSGALVHYFFLSAFFWMNVMSFDVWRALRLATKKLVSTSTKLRLKKFLSYSMYAWGLPLIITTTTVVIDNLDGIPEAYKPGYGNDDICWINADSAKLLFFAGPAFLLFVINAMFFVASAYLILTNTIKDPGDQHKVAKRNLILYVRLGVIMGITWMIGVISALAKYEVLWFIFDILNSLQGLFVFLFFPCSRECWRYIRGRAESETTKSTTIQTSSMKE